MSDAQYASAWTSATIRDGAPIEEEKALLAWLAARVKKREGKDG